MIKFFCKTYFLAENAGLFLYVKGTKCLSTHTTHVKSRRFKTRHTKAVEIREYLSTQSLSKRFYDAFEQCSISHLSALIKALYKKANTSRGPHLKSMTCTVHRFSPQCRAQWPSETVLYRKVWIASDLR